MFEKKASVSNNRCYEPERPLPTVLLISYSSGALEWARSLSLSHSIPFFSPTQLPSFDSKTEVVVKIRPDLDLGEAEALGVIGWRYKVDPHEKNTLRKIKYKKFVVPLPTQAVPYRNSEYKIGKS